MGNIFESAPQKTKQERDCHRSSKNRRSIQTFSVRKAVIHYRNSETIHHISVKQGKLPKTVSIRRQKRQPEKDPHIDPKQLTP